MTSGQKVAVSLLLTIFLFTGFVVLAFSGFFSLIETRFYQPSLIKAIEENLKSISLGFSDYTDEQFLVFDSYAKNESIKSVSNPAQNAEDIAERSKLFSETTAKFPGFLGLKVVDTNGKYIHYSSFDTDVLKQQSNAISYKNYDTTTEYPYEELAIRDLILDTSKNQLIFSFPYINDYGTEQGRVLFYVSAKDFNRYLISHNLINVNQTTNLINNSSKNNPKIGFILGFPVVNQDFFTTAVQEKWNMDLFTPQSILDTESGKWVVISDNSSSKITVAAVEQESYFLFSDTVKILLLACIFISIYLIFFLLFNLKQDSMVVIKHKIKKFQLAFINQYLEKENSSNWETLKTEINKRKNDLSLEVKKSLGTKAKRHSKEIDSFLSKSWDDILSVLTTNKNVQVPATSNATSNINMDEIKSMLEQILSSGTITVQSAPEPQKTTSAKATISKPVVPVTKLEKVETVEELDEVEELPEEVEELTDDVEELDEVEELTEEAEELDEVEELPEEIEELTDDVEELNEVEEFSEEVEELDEVEELEEVEELDEIEELTEEAEELTDDVEELTEEAEELDEVEELTDDVEELPEDMEELTEEVEELPEEVEELTDDVEELDEVEELSEDMEELTEEVEELPEDVEELEEVEELSEEVEELEEEAEELDEVEELTEEVEELTEEPEIPTPTETQEDYFVEPLIFSDGGKKSTSVLSDQKDTFEVFKPDFSFLDENPQEITNSQEIHEDKTEELKQVSKTTHYFSFTNYGAASVVKDLNSVDYDPKPISSIEEDNGIFHIRHNIDTSKVKQDINFKELVESVLK